MKTKLIHACLFTPTNDGWGLPIVLIGKPGVAKSSTFRQIGDSTGLHVEILAVGERGEGAFGVTPFPAEDERGAYMSYPPPSYVRDLVDSNGDEAGIVLIDEINTAPPALQPALMGAILDKRIGGHKCGGRIRMFGAMNPVGHAAGGWDLAAPVANRFGHIHWEAPDADEWVAWLGSGASSLAAVDTKAEEARVTAAWPEAWARATSMVGAFIMRRPELLHRQPDDNDPAASGPWPSPRTWEMATRAIASGFIHELGEIEMDELITAFVGADAAGEFLVWLESNDLPDPADLLDGNATFEHDPTRFDKTVAVLSSCVSLVRNENGTNSKRTAALWSLLAKVMTDAKDLVVGPATALARAGLTKNKEAKAVLAELHVVVAAAKGA